MRTEVSENETRRAESLYEITCPSGQAHVLVREYNPDGTVGQERENFYGGECMVCYNTFVVNPPPAGTPYTIHARESTPFNNLVDRYSEYSFEPVGVEPLSVAAGSFEAWQYEASYVVARVDLGTNETTCNSIHETRFYERDSGLLLLWEMEYGFSGECPEPTFDDFTLTWELIDTNIPLGVPTD
jgi:hypothetical protein